MPKAFQFPIGRDNVPVDLWTTVAALRESADGSQPMTAQRGNSFLGCIARLKDGAVLARGAASVDTVSAPLAQQFPEDNAPVAVRVRRLSDAVVGQPHSGFMML